MPIIEPTQKTAYQRNLDYINNNAPLDIAGSGASASGGTTNSAPLSTSGPTGLPDNTTAPTSSPSNPSVLSDAGSKARDVSGAISGLTQTFQRDATPAPEMPSAEDLWKLNLQVSMPGSPMADAAGSSLGLTPEDLVNAEYKGPTELPSDDVAKITRDAAELGDTARALQTGGGLETLIHAENPNMTPGMARFEAALRRSDPNYRGESQRMVEELQDVPKQLNKATADARALGEQRQAEYSDVAGQAVEHFEGLRDEALTSARSRLEIEKKKRQDMLDAYAKFQETGDTSLIAPYVDDWYDTNWGDYGGSLLAGAMSEGAPRSLFDTETLRERDAAVEARDAALAKLPGYLPEGVDLPADIEPLMLAISSHGREKFKLPPELAEGRTTKEKRQLKKALVEWYETEMAPFAPDTKRGDEGDMALYAPYDLYPEGTERAAGVPALGDLELPDPRSFVDYDPGVMPTLENMTSEDERVLINTVSDLLGESDRLVEAGQPLRASELTARIDEFLAAEERALEEQKNSLSESAKRWKKWVNRARSSYRRNKKKQQGFSGGGLFADLNLGALPLAVI